MPAQNNFNSPQTIQIIGYNGSAMEPFLARDGSGTLFWNSSNTDANTDIFWGVQDQKNPLKVYANGPLAGANSASLDGVPSMDLANNFYFISPRNFDPSKPNQNTLFCAQYSNGSISNVIPVQGITTTPPHFDMDCEISPDGRTLLVCDTVTQNGMEQSTIQLFVANNGAFVLVNNSDAILATVNAIGTNYAPSITANLLTLCWTRFDPSNGSPPQLYLATRRTANEAFGDAVHLDQATGFVEGGCISANGQSIIFHHQKSDGTFELQMMDNTAYVANNGLLLGGLGVAMAGLFMIGRRK